MPVCNCSYLQAERERLITEVVLDNIQKGFRIRIEMENF